MKIYFSKQSDSVYNLEPLPWHTRSLRFTPIGGQDTSKPIPYNPSDPISQQITKSFQVSLANLHTTYIDSYLLHSPLPTIEQTLEAWRTLIKLQDEGKVRMIGLSNTYDVRILAALQKARKVQVVQNRWYEGNQWDRQVLNYCREHEIIYQLRVAVAVVFWFLGTEWERRSFWTLSGSPSLVGHPAITRIANASGLTAEQTVYRFAQLNGVIPLSGTTNEDHMRQDVDVEKRSLKEEGLESSWAVVKQIIGQWKRNFI